MALDTIYTFINQILLAKAPEVVSGTSAELSADYKGFWIQVGASELVYKTFEKGGSCASATYTPNGDTILEVLNEQLVDGELDSVTGEATWLDSDVGGALKVTFPFDSINPMEKLDLYNYLIVALGDVVEAEGSYDGGYGWAIVTDPGKLFNFVLARSPEVFKDNYDEIVDTVERLHLDGFLGKFNRMVWDDWIECDAIRMGTTTMEPSTTMETYPTVEPTSTMDSSTMNTSTVTPVTTETTEPPTTTTIEGQAR